MDHHANRVEAERLLGIAEKLLQNRDLSSSRDFAILAQETEPLLDGSDQILAVVEVLQAAEKRINNQHDWYGILQVDRRSSDDQDLIKKSYRRLALLLHPDKNKYAFADHAFKFVVDAWSVLSDPTRKPVFDTEVRRYAPVDLNPNELPVRRGGRGGGGGGQRSNGLSSFWTACPYCYVLYEYPGVYQNCCMRCQNCKRGFEAVSVPNLPPIVQGQDAYYCCWGFFPMGYVGGGSKGKSTAAATFPTWMPPMFTNPPAAQEKTPVAATPIPAPVAAADGNHGILNFSGGNTNSVAGTTQKKRGRPRKYA